MIQLVLLATGMAAGDPALRCGPGTDGPPDPRCAESLDGRPPPPEPPPPVPGMLLWPPRLASRALFWPVVSTMRLVEKHHVHQWLTAWLTTDDGKMGVRPEFQYASGFLPTVGARVFNRRWPPDHLTVLRFQTAGPSTWLAELDWRAPPALGLTATVRAQRRRDWLFAGIGPRTDDELERAGRGEARYEADGLLGELGYTRAFGGLFKFALITDIERRDYDSGGASEEDAIATVYGLPPEQCLLLGFDPGCVDPDEVPGFNRDLHIFHFGVGLALDRAPTSRYASGARLAARVTYGKGFAGDESHHVRFDGEALWVVGGLDRTLRMRLAAAEVDPIGSAVVPFERLVSPAGAPGMRGFSSGRFRDRTGLAATLEYRWFISFNLDASLFAEVGTVAGPQFSGLWDGPLFPSFGIGFRKTSSERPYWEADSVGGIQIAYAPEGALRLILSLATF